jgi:hypothetical protein
VSLLVTAYGSGLDADALVEAHPTARGVPPDAIDGALSALAGYYLVSAGLGDSEASPALRTHQRWTGELTLSWLASRRRWPRPSQR